MGREAIHTDKAPDAIGAYSQAIRCGQTVYLSGQIPLLPGSMELVEGTREQIVQVFNTLSAVAEAAGGSLAQIAKLTVFLPDLAHCPLVNEVMGEFFAEPWPARAAIGVAALPKGASVEVDAIMVLDD